MVRYTIVCASSSSQTHSTDVIVLTQIHSDMSNKLTIESNPPEARYLGIG